MDYAQALHGFWSSFDWKAYDSATVPSEKFSPAIPRITYEVAMSEFEQTNLVSASLWDKGTSWERISKKADEIYDRIGLGGIIISHDDGMIWIKRSSPFATRMADEDENIRRVYLQLEIENFTNK